MASIGHIAVGLAAARLYRRTAEPTSSLVFRFVAFSAASLLPDADVIAFGLGIPYEAPFGHRGASHSIVFALLCGLVAGLIAARGTSRARGIRVGLFIGAIIATHGPLDALTDGGEGVALFWPFSTQRLFFPWRPLPVSPIGIHFLSRAGLAVAKVEILAFAPLFLFGLWPRRHARAAP